MQRLVWPPIGTTWIILSRCIFLLLVLYDTMKGNCNKKGGIIHMQSLWWQVFDILGTTAFALSGALVAVSRRMDLFGIFVLAAATAVGGGIIRDVLLGNVPPAAFKTSLYLWIILATMLVCSMGIRYIRMSSQRRFMHYSLIVYICCDAVGLGSFTVTGTLLGCFYYPQYWILCITLGALTAVGGGVIRDVLAGRIPGVLRQEIYATASLAGSLIIWWLYVPQDQSVTIAAVSGFVVTVVLRLVAVYFHWNLPRVKRSTKNRLF